MKGLRALAVIALAVLVPGVSQATIGSELNGFGSFGISLGLMRWFSDADARRLRTPAEEADGGWSYVEGSAAQVRPIGKAVFRYRVNRTYLVSVETGFGWNSYANSGNVVTWVIPTTVGIERRIGELKGTTASLCFGGGAYVWGRRKDSDFLLDPQTSRKLHAVDPGLYVGAASEFHLSGHVTCALHSTLHYILNLHDDDFPVTLGGDDLFADVRIGVNYYFSPYEGMVVRPGGEDRPREPQAPPPELEDDMDE